MENYSGDLGKTRWSPSVKLRALVDLQHMLIYSGNVFTGMFLSEIEYFGNFNLKDYSSSLSLADKLKNIVTYYSQSKNSLVGII